MHKNDINSRVLGILLLNSIFSTFYYRPRTSGSVATGITKYQHPSNVHCTVQYTIVYYYITVVEINFLAALFNSHQISQWNRKRNIYLLIEIHTCLKNSVTQWHNGYALEQWVTGQLGAVCLHPVTQEFRIQTFWKKIRARVLLNMSLGFHVFIQFTE